jgi:hypothetical protein
MYKLCPDFGSIYKQLISDTDFDLYERLLKDMKAQMHKQSSMRTDKQKIPKGKLIVTVAQAKKAIATGKYMLHKALLYHTNIPFFYFELNLRLSVHVSKSLLRREHALGHGVGYFEYAAALL